MFIGELDGSDGGCSASDDIPPTFAGRLREVWRGQVQNQRGALPLPPDTSQTTKTLLTHGREHGNHFKQIPTSTSRSQSMSFTSLLDLERKCDKRTLTDMFHILFSSRHSKWQLHAVAVHNTPYNIINVTAACFPSSPQLMTTVPA